MGHTRFNFFWEASPGYFNWQSTNVFSWRNLKASDLRGEFPHSKQRIFCVFLEPTGNLWASDSFVCFTKGSFEPRDPPLATPMYNSTDLCTIQYFFT